MSIRDNLIFELRGIIRDHIPSLSVDMRQIATNHINLLISFFNQKEYKISSYKLKKHGSMFYFEVRVEYMVDGQKFNQTIIYEV